METNNLPSPQTEGPQVMPSFFCTIASSESKPLISHEELVRTIRHDAMLAARTDDYRKRLPIGKEFANEAKRMTPGITASALMDGTGKELRNLVSPTYLVQVDIDKIPDDRLQDAILKADADPHTRVRFITVSGHGLRIIAAYQPLEDEEVTVLELFDVMVRKAISHYSTLLGLPADEKCVDITRMCGLAHDETAYFNWHSTPFALDARDLKALYTKKATEAKYARRNSPRRRASQKMAALAKGVPSMAEAAEHIARLMERWGYRFESGSHNEYVAHWGKTCVRYGIDRDEALDYANTHFGSDYADTAAVMKSCYKHTELLGSWHFYRKGEKYEGHPSAKTIKQWLSMRYMFHHNTVTGFYEIQSRDAANGRYRRWTRLDDNIENSIWSLMDEDGLNAPQTKLHTIINSEFSAPWDPFEEYLQSLPQWDGTTDHIGKLADRIRVVDCHGYHHTQDDFRYFFKKWLVSMVVAWVSPKVVSQSILIFIGKGGIFKTTFFNYLLPPCLREYFDNDSTAAYTDKDFMEAFSSKALICLDELEQSFGKNLSAFKSNVTKLVFSIRRPYDKYRSELIHRAALCGTSNTLQIIGDEENRRFSPWYVENIESPREHPIDYQNVYAQAVAIGREVTERQSRDDAGWVFWLTPEDIETMREHNAMFMVTNFMADQILRYYEAPVAGTDSRFVKFRYSAEIMERIGGNPALSRNLNFQNLVAVMQQLGFKKIRRNKGWGWLVMEKEPCQMNTEAVCSPGETSVLRE